jgi:signal transduction histidine kinase
VRLFLKLFLSFWGTVLLVGSVMAWFSYHSRGEIDRLLHRQLTVLIAERQRIGTLLQQEGSGALRAMLETHPYRDFLFVSDAAGQEVLGRELPGPGFPAGPPADVPPPPPHVLEVRDPAGALFRVMIGPHAPHVFMLVRHQPWSLLVMVGCSGLLVYWLARHFTRPIQVLRGNLLELARGNFTLRAGLPPRRLADEFTDLVRDLNFTAARLEEMFTARTRLLRDVSHELRSPLARMRAALGLIERQQENWDSNHQRLEQEIDRLDHLIGQIITLSRPSGPQPLQQAIWVDLIALARSVLDDAAYEGTHRGQTLALRAGDELVVFAEGTRLHSALENLVRNAMRHSPDGGTIVVEVQQQGQDAVLNVMDQGCGVPEADLERIFQPFFRVDEARDRRQGGGGLGLAIAARAVQDHGGTIQARNRPEGGLLVTMRLPVGQEAADGWAGS